MATTADPSVRLEQISDAYSAAWGARDVDRIVAMHAPDTRFQLHLGGEPVEGREAVRSAFAALLEQWPGFGVESHRVLIGDRHWVLDWTMTSTGGPAGDVRLDCLDVVTVGDDGLVARKDTYVDATGLSAGGGS